MRIVSWAPVLIACLPLGAETGARERYSAVMGSMRDSLARQRASVRRQAILARVVADPGTAERGVFFPLPPPLYFVPVQRPSLCPPLGRDTLAHLVELVGRREGIAPEVLGAVVRQESAGDRCAVSPKGAQGLMQLLPATAARFDVADPFDAEQNLTGGARYLRELLQRYGGSWMLALGAYNAGPRRVDEAGGLPPIAETRDYVGSILSQLDIE